MLPWHEFHRSKVSFPDSESDNQGEADDNETDDHRGSPLSRLVGVQVERQQEKGKANGNDQQANSIELNAVEDNILEEGSSTGILLCQIHLFGLLLNVVSQTPERGADNGHDDGCCS